MTTTEFLPKFAPGQTWTAKTSTDVSAGQLLIVTGNGTVGVSSTDTVSVAVVGVASFDAKSGGVVTVSSGGIAAVSASGAVSAGDLVVPAKAGKVSALAAAASTPTQADVTGNRAAIGVPLTDAESGQQVLVQFTRF